MDGEDGEAYTARVAGELRQELGIPERGKGAIDLAIEASGAPTCVQIGLAVLKPAYVLSKYIPIYRETDQGHSHNKRHLCASRYGRQDDRPRSPLLHHLQATPRCRFLPIWFW